jgi:drug/metabolite transporter (DMT)-like permease
MLKKRFQMLPGLLKQNESVFLLVCAALCWSTGGVLTKCIDWNPAAIAGMRSVIGGLMVLLVLGRPSFTWTFSQVGGGIAFAGTMISYVIANKLTTAANAILLQYTAPIYVALLGPWLLGERTTRFDWIMIVVVLGGMVLFFLDSLTLTGFWGNISGIFCGFTFGLFALFMRKQKGQSNLESLLIGCMICTVVSLPFMVRDIPDVKSWFGLVLLGILQFGLPFILYARAVKNISALDSMLIPIIEPLLNPLWVFLILKEVPGIYALVAGAIILLSVIIRTFIIAGKESKSKETSEY